MVPFSLVKFPSQTLDTGYLFLSLPLELFGGFIRQLTTLFHHVDFSAILRVRS
jgi:hypothetical protein